MKKYNLRRGILVAIEGIDGAGKTTQVTRIKDYFNLKGIITSSFKEPTDGQYGKLIKEISRKGREGISPEYELQLFLKDREENRIKNIQPALERKELVLVDRYYFSSIAYQGAIGLDKNYILVENEKIAVVPDLVIILDCAVRVGLNRIKMFRNETPNHFEKEEYLEKVREIFRSMKAEYIQLIDSSRDEETVFQHIKNIVSDLVYVNAKKIEDQQDLFSSSSNAEQEITFSRN